MSHHIYTTEAYVFKHDYTRDSDALIYLFTQDLGYIRAVATGSRYEKSKHRFALQDFSKITVSLVQGKTGWRITSAQHHKNIYNDLYENNKGLFSVFARAIKTLQRFLQGEEGDYALYNSFDHAIQFGYENLADHNQSASFVWNKENLKNFELLLMVRILGQLGYATEPKYLNEPNTETYSINYLEIIKKHTPELIKMINTALHQSHL